MTATITTTLTTAITPGVGNYAAGITITSSGAVETANAQAAVFIQSLVSGVTLTNAGLIQDTGTGFGIDSNATASPAFIVNTGTIIGPTAIYTTGTVNNHGLISGSSAAATSFGVDLLTGSLINSGTITSANIGVYGAVHGYVTNTGSISGSSAGVDLHFQSSLANSGHISSAKDGVVISSLGEGVTNTGVIYGQTYGVVERSTFSGTFLTIINSGSIGGGVDGINLLHNEAVVNKGTISGAVAAILSTLDVYLSIYPNAVFHGGVTAGGGGQLTLAGTSAGSFNMGTSFAGFNQISFVSGAAWVLQGDSAELAGPQTITGFTLGDSLIIDNFAATSETFTQTGGVTLRNATASITLDVHGDPVNAAFSLSTDGTNSTLAAAFAPPASIISAPISSPVTLGVGNYAKNVTVTQSGTVKVGYAFAVYDPVGTTGGSLTNDGLLTGQASVVFSGSALNITNAGTIATIFSNDLGASGVALGAGGVVDNTGTIEAAYSFALSLTAGGTIINAGLISGGTNASGTVALTNKSGALVFVEEAGGVVRGKVLDTPGTGQLTLAGSTAGSLTMASYKSGSLISNFTGFKNISFADSAGWVLQGSAAELAAGQTIAGLTVGDTIILAGFAATADSLISGSDLVLSNASASQSLDLTGLSSSDHLDITSNGTSSTIAVLAGGPVTVINTLQTLGVTLGFGNYTSLLTIGSAGDIAAAGTALSAAAPATILNDGTVSGAYGVRLANGGTLINLGTLSGAKDAVLAGGAFSLIIEPGAAFNGAVVDSAGTGGITLAGSSAGSINIGSSFTGFSAINFADSAGFTLEGSTTALAAGSAIAGFTLGDTIILDGFAATAETLTATGLVLSNATGATTLALTGSLNASLFSLTSSGSSSTIVAEAAPPPKVSLISTLLAAEVTPGRGSYAAALSITSTGVVLGGNYAIFATATTPNVSVTNSGTIIGGNGSYAGVHLIGPAQLTNNGSIRGGVYLGQSSTASNSGVISADGYFAALVDITSSFSNTGKVIGNVNDSNGVISNRGTISAGLADNGGTINNSGVIESGVVESGGTLINSGAVSATTQAGLSLSNAGLLSNSGTVSATNTAINIVSGTTAIAGTVINTGLISASLAGILVSGNALISNAGTINGGLDAIYSSGNLNLTVDPGAVFSGAVVDKTGFGAITLAGTSAGGLDLGSSFSGFSSLSFANAAGFSLEAASLALANGQVISGFTAGDTIILDGFTATADSIAGTGLVLSNATASATLGLSSLAAGHFDVTSVGGKTTITAATTPLVSLVTAPGTIALTPGFGNYAANLTIGAGGAVSGVGTGLFATAPVTIFNQGSISGTVYGIEIGAGTITNAGTITGGTDAIYATGALTLIVNPGAVFNGNVVDKGGAGDIILAGTTAGTLNLADPFTGFNTFSFAAGSDFLLEGTAAELANGETILGFSSGESIGLTDFTASSGSYVSGTGLVLSNGTTSETLHVSGRFATKGFAISNGLVTALCFARGTRIQTPRRKIAVERLAPGDEVVTQDGRIAPVRWIGTRSYDGAFIRGNHLALPVTIKRHAIAKNVPCRDLTVSPGHGIMLSGVLVPAWRLINGVTITQAEAVDRVDYFHVELDQHAVLLAENCPAESFYGEDFRAQFQNAASFTGLPPTGAPLPRCEQGFLLQTLQRRLAFRAGLTVTPPPTPGSLRGFMDEAGPHRLRGWAQSLAAPDAPLVLEVIHAGAKIQTILANQYRPDLRAAGLGAGCHGFDVACPAGLTSLLELRETSSGWTLPHAQIAAKVSNAA
jgi:hypothetical protein